MDVVVVGKSEHGGKNELEIRRHRRRRRRRNAKLTKVGRFARRKRERKKSVTRYEPTGRGKSCKREEKKVYIHISIEWHWVNRCSPKKVASNMSIGALSSTSWGVTFLPRLETVLFLIPREAKTSCHVYRTRSNYGTRMPPPIFSHRFIFIRFDNFVES